MKKHLAIVCGIFYPEPSPTGLCAKRFADILADGYEIEIICLSENHEYETVVYEEGIKVHKLAGYRMSAESKSKGFTKKVIHLLGGLQVKTQILGNLKWYRKAAFKKLEEINDERAIDVVFSVCSPFAAHCAAKDFKNAHPSVHWCGYTVDPYATKNRIRPFWCSYKRLIEAERTVLRSMDYVLLSEEVAKNRKELYIGCRASNELPYILPEFSAAEGERRFFDEKDINCVYAGSFYEDIRNPECMLAAFLRLNDSRIKLHLFSKGCEDLVKKYADRSSNIIVHKRVSTTEIAQVYRDADVLVSLENATLEFMPSKIFEYIVTGKPIINYYYESCFNRVLEKYPLCLQLQNSFALENIDQLEKFILTHGKETVEMKDITKLYQRHTSVFASGILYDAMGGESSMVWHGRTR